jgi:RNA methyltransferase, TrmH family
VSGARPGPDLPARYGAARRDPGLAVLEGLHALKHALRFGADVLDARTPDPDALARLAARLAPDLAERIAVLARPTDGATFGKLAPSEHPTGVIALARRPDGDPGAALAAAGPAPVVFLDRPTHHGNIGAAVRVAAAGGAAALLSSGPHDPWHPAALRGGAGLQFALPVHRADELPPTDRPIVALDPAGLPLPENPPPPRAVLVFGSERTGIGEALLARATLRVSIPMRPGVSSLNLATAVAVAVFCGGTVRGGL